MHAIFHATLAYHGLNKNDRVHGTFIVYDTIGAHEACVFERLNLCIAEYNSSSTTEYYSTCSDNNSYELFICVCRVHQGHVLVCIVARSRRFVQSARGI